MSLTNESVIFMTALGLYDNLNQGRNFKTETARHQIQTRRPEAGNVTGLRKQAEVDRAL